MSFTNNFARLVVLAGHGANVVNNPFASGLHCGACGGYSGEVNARLLAGLLNNADVRTGLALRDIALPDDTLFVAALHDTTTDAVTLYTQDCPSSAHAADIENARFWFMAAGKATRSERSLRLPRSTDNLDIVTRSRDWAETRPEWALAGCSAFIAAPRRRTAGKNMEGRAFLHDYDWAKDKDFGVLGSACNIMDRLWPLKRSALVTSFCTTLPVVSAWLRATAALCAQDFRGNRSMKAAAMRMNRCACRSASRLLERQ
jgi:uncharacterized protein YbcC (UPF0753/DUF2309 family)